MGDAGTQTRTVSIDATSDASSNFDTGIDVSGNSVAASVEAG
jgi:hypothetical protein